jgi:hypothetical protein
MQRQILLRRKKHIMQTRKPKEFKVNLQKHAGNKNENGTWKYIMTIEWICHHFLIAVGEY